MRTLIRAMDSRHGRDLVFRLSEAKQRGMVLLGKKAVPFVKWTTSD
jgi:hypothetical protein